MRLTSATALVLGAVLALGACAQQTTTSAPAAAAATASKGDVAKTASGVFIGKSNHITTGHASIGRVGNKWVVVLEDDFTFDGAPDPHVALGSDGYRKDASLSLLSSNSGRQVYEIPATLDVAEFNEVWIWCDKFAVPLGLAKLTLT
ncbi:MAG: DM13 domain-containing protein [Pseudomonadota bacterium]